MGLMVILRRQVRWLPAQWLVNSPSTREELRRYLENHDSSAIQDVRFPDNYRKDVDQCE